MLQGEEQSRVGVVLSPRSFRPFAIGAVAVVLFLASLQVAALKFHFPGPVPSIYRDYFGTPKSMAVPWAGLVLAVIALPMRARAWALAAAVLIDAAALLIRLEAGGGFAIGNGAVIVLTALAGYAIWTHNLSLVRSASLGGLLILATKAGDAWLHLTAVARPYVLDEYAQLADHALGNPSWLAGQVLAELGPGVSAVLHWVYIQLPVAAIAIALYQLRGVASGRAWPTHYLLRTFLLIGLIGPVFYILFPVVGPIFAFGTDGEGFQLGNFWPTLIPFDASPSEIPFDDETPRNCMPSLHTAWAVSLFIHSRRGPWWLRWGGGVWLVFTLAATLGFGYHYGVDLIAGAVLALTIESLVRDPERGWDRGRLRVIAFGTVLLVALLLSYRWFAGTFAAYPEIFGPGLLLAVAAMAGVYYLTFYAPTSAGVTADRIRLPSR